MRRGQGRQSQRRDLRLNCVGGCVAPRGGRATVCSTQRAEGDARLSRTAGLRKRNPPRQLSVNLVRRVFCERDEAAEAALGGFLARPSRSSAASLGCFTPTPGKRAGGRASEQSRVVSRAALGVRAAMRRLSLQQNGSGGPGAVACC